MQHRPYRKPATSLISSLALICGLTLAMTGPTLGADAAAGARAWTEEHNPADGSAPRSCATCHTADLTKTGKHATTGKAIEPMAVSVNPERLTDPAKVEKWFGRNCRWTLGRDCTPEEKGNFLAFIKSK
jgi:hypothetical protein